MATDLRLSVANQNRFALRLAAAVSSAGNAASSAGNAAFSPLSLHVALSLVAAGAGGATRDQLAAVLGAGGTDELHALGAQVVELVLADASGAGGPRVAFADSIFVDESLSLKPLFKEIAAGKYKAETQSVDFQTKAAEVINQVNLWVENITSGLIKELLPPGSVDRSTRLVLGNALYFKGVWTEKFNASETENGEFHLLHGSSVQVPFMTSTNDQYLSCYNNLKVLRLPYKQGEDERQFSMYILLPEARDGLWSLAQKLSSGPEFLENHLPTQKVEVRRVMVPKFKISFGFEASNLFKGLGLQLPFGADADLSEMVDSPLSQNLCVSSIFQKSFVEVNEEGTEAAAASAVVTRLVSLSLTSKYFVADHPFLFLIREEKTGVVLFIGHVLNPLLVP